MPRLVTSMPLFPEHLLVRRYSIQADLWGMRRELSELERDVAQAYAALHGIQKNVDSTNRLSKAAIKQGERHWADIARAKERTALVARLAEEKRNELVKVEQELRVVYKSLGQDTLFSQTLSETDMAKDSTQVGSESEGPSGGYAYHVFISHAFEDKNDIVRPMATALQDLFLKVWYDEWRIKVGDGLRESIDRGVLNSRFGIVVLSPSFLAKHKWTTYELDSLFTREIEMGKVILPLWHKVTKNEVLSFSPKLADKIALNTAVMTIDEIALEIALVVSEESSRHARLNLLPCLGSAPGTVVQHAG
jgi:hypothetical protein